MSKSSPVCISLSEFHTADEVFVTGTMRELSYVVEIDGRRTGDGNKGRFTTQLQQIYTEKTQKEGVELPF